MALLKNCTCLVLCLVQVVLLQAYMQRNHRLLQILQEKLLGLRSILDVAQARCQAEGAVKIEYAVGRAHNSTTNAQCTASSPAEHGS